MKVLSINKLVDYRKMSDRSKKNFVDNIKSTKIEETTEGGGNYWVSCVSTASSSFRANDVSIIDEKIAELKQKASDTSFSITRTMYNRNIANLELIKTIDAKNLRPGAKLEFLKKSGTNPVLTVKGIQVKSNPNLIFTYNKNGIDFVGSLWFIATLNGYKPEEQGMFCELLYRFLKSNYAKKYSIESRYCSIVDVSNGSKTNYSEIEKGKVPAILVPTLEEINRLS
jgi:hypothetical protein